MAILGPDGNLPDASSRPGKKLSGKGLAKTNSFADMQVERQLSRRPVNLTAAKWRHLSHKLMIGTNIANTGRPTEFQNEFVEGRCYMRTRSTQHTMDQQYFIGKRRIADFQVQMRFKKLPPGKLFVGWEGSRGTPDWGWWTKQMVKIARRIASSRVPDFVAVW